MLEPESGDKGCTSAVSSWDRRGKVKLKEGRSSFIGTLASQTGMVDCLLKVESLFIGERKAAKLSFGGATS